MVCHNFTRHKNNGLQAAAQIAHLKGAFHVIFLGVYFTLGIINGCI